jgi:hypothetical protein
MPKLIFLSLLLQDLKLLSKKIKFIKVNQLSYQCAGIIII